MNSPSDNSGTESSLPWTGERFLPSIKGSIYYEHLHRYAFALELIDGRKCLDIACGEGFGSALLARKAKFVWGVDIDENCVAHADRKYQKSNLKYLAGSATRIPLEDKSVDAVVSFETIEHFSEHEAFMQEISRVLTPGGILIISSPDKKEYTDASGHSNTFHVAELYQAEFESLLKRHFSHIKLARQRLVAGSFILAEETESADTTSVGVFRGNTTGTHFEKGLPNSAYGIAICSNQALPPIKYGLFEDPLFLSGKNSLDAQFTSAAEIERMTNLLNERAIALEVAQIQINQLTAEKNYAHRQHEVEKAFWMPKLLEQSSTPEQVHARIDRLVHEMAAVRASLEQAMSGRAQKQVEGAPNGHRRSWFAPALRMWRKPKILEADESEAKLIVDSGFFDENFYTRLYPDVIAAGADPLEHYVKHGRREGRVPSDKFDPRAYLEANPDVRNQAEDPLLHYLRHGKKEGRPLVTKAELEVEEQLLRYKPQKPAVIVVSHDASRTGAPILVYNIARELMTKFDVTMVFLGSGPVLEASRSMGANVIGPIGLEGNQPKADRLAALLQKHIRPEFALVNSVVSWRMGCALSNAGITTVSLVHEFATYSRPPFAMAELVSKSDATIFSTALTRDNALENFVEFSKMDLPVIPQGQCALPPDSDEDRKKSAAAKEKNRQAVRPSNFPAGGIVVVGMGFVQLRKGVDLFLDCATRVKRMNLPIPVRFVWVGKGYDPKVDVGYSAYLADQIRRSGLEDTAHILDEMACLEDAYAASDIFLLTSRLDPLPNVAIDVLTKGKPVICFDQTTGIADYLKAHGMADLCVARYLDTGDMVAKLVNLIESKSLRQDIGARSVKMGAELFSMPHYVDKLVEIAEKQAGFRQEVVREAEELVSAQLLRQDFIIPPGNPFLSPSRLAQHYLRGWKKNIYPRKPFPGFHPGIYQEIQDPWKTGPDPLIDYLRAGQPPGPWRFPLITPDSPRPTKAIPRVAIHLHAFYPDVVPSILERLELNRSVIDLFISVTSEDSRDEVLRNLRGYRSGKIDVRIVPNVGRDLGPMITCFAEAIRSNYDIMGHIHTKKSAQFEARLGAEWAKFLFDNLLGGPAPMADIILRTMAEDERIGLVFPDDPNVLSWGKNRPFADDLALRLKLPPLPEELNFPVGTMFWSRVSALDALFDLKLSWEDYPKEPLPGDGSILHAIERLLPSIAAAAGYSVAVTNVPGVSR